jgi:hypothetical protein
LTRSALSAVEPASSSQALQNGALAATRALEQRQGWLRTRTTSGASRLKGVSALAVGIAQTPTIVDANIPLVGPTSFLKPLHEGRYASLGFRIVHAKTPGLWPITSFHNFRPRPLLVDPDMTAGTG